MHNDIWLTQILRRFKGFYCSIWPKYREPFLNRLVICNRPWGLVFERVVEGREEEGADVDGVEGGVVTRG